jgi:ethanolamine utilization protein EutQ
MQRSEIEALVREILSAAPGVKRVALPEVSVLHEDRLDTGNPADRVYTHDVLTLAESPRLGAGIMEMTKSDFPWTLNYDEIDYVISGALTVAFAGQTVTARAGEMIFIPKGSAIRFQAPEFARFLYVTYPADWQGAG